MSLYIKGVKYDQKRQRIKEGKNMKIPQNKTYYLNTEPQAAYTSSRQRLQPPKQTVSNIKALQ